MRYRILSVDGDYVFGAGIGEFLVNSAAAVAQAVQTRLLLSTGEWFLDVNEGTPYRTEILGTGTQQIYDQAVQDRILGTPGVRSILEYASSLDEKRNLQINCLIDTIYGGTVSLVGPSITPTGGAAFILDVSELDVGVLT